MRIADGVLLGALLLWGQVQAVTPDETVTSTEELSFSAHAVNVCDWNTPVFTFNDVLYFVWVDPGLRTMIAQKHPDGTVDTAVVFTGVGADDMYHLGPSVGVDRNGYIHVVGNMHHTAYRDEYPNTRDYAWIYFVSDQPEDISSFSDAGGDAQRTIPGTGISYAIFAADLDGELYAAFRQRITYSHGWSPGVMAGGIARYDTDSRSWTMLGGTDYPYAEEALTWTTLMGQPKNAVIWSQYGAQNSAYQGYKVQMHFDWRNWMHITWNVHDNTSAIADGATWVMYAYSDDGGDTFKHANGTTAALPMTEQNGDVVSENTHAYYNITHVGVTADGSPMVSFGKNSNWEYSLWSTSGGWSSPEFFADHPGRFVTDLNGVITAVEQAGWLKRSFDNGQTWKSYEVSGVGGGASTIFDKAYLAQTSQLRFNVQSGSTVAVYTVEFSGSEPPVGIGTGPEHAAARRTNAGQPGGQRQHYDLSGRSLLKQNSRYPNFKHTVVVP